MENDIQTIGRYDVADKFGLWLLERGPYAGRRISLLTKAQALALEPGLRFVAINGDVVISGEADLDTRWGFVAFGPLVED